jgi:hypothetical protein
LSFLIGLHLGFQTIAVGIKDKIHTAVIMARFFKKAAFFLLLGVLGGADRHIILFAIVGFRITHLKYLLQTSGRFCITASIGLVSRQRPPAKQVAWIFGHRPKRQKRTVVLFALNLPPGAKHPLFMARISVVKISNRCTRFFFCRDKKQKSCQPVGLRPI